MTAAPVNSLVYGPFLPREIARERGYKRYYVNQPCKRGHVAPRSTKSGNCTRCDCDRKRSDPTKALAQRKAMTPEELRIWRRLQKMKPPNFRYWESRGVFVYVYLSKKLKPYYVGIASNRTRPISPHSFPVPKDRRFIQIMKAGLTWEEAAKWEQRYISHYGRVDNGTGCLWNQTDGGEGRYGWEVPQETREAIAKGHRTKAVEAARKYGIPLDYYLSLDTAKRSALKSWLDRNPNLGYEVYFDLEARAKIENEQLRRRGESKSRNTAKKLGVPEEVWLQWTSKERRRYEAWAGREEGRTYADFLVRDDQPHWASGSTQSKELIEKRMRPVAERTAKKLGIPVQWWLDADPKIRAAVHARWNRGERSAEALMADLQTGANSRSLRAAKRFGIPVEWWEEATVLQRNALRARFYRGLKGDELMEGL